MSIQKFYQAAVANDFARAFQFRVDSMSFGGPGVGSQKRINFNYSTGAGETLYVETASLPGRVVNNIQVPFMGLSFNVPGTASFPGSNNYPVVFRCDQNYAIRATLEQALVDIFNISQTAGNYNTPSQENTLTMTLFGKTPGSGENLPAPVRTYTLVGVYLVGLQDTGYDVKDTGTVALINATLAYQYWKVGTTQVQPSVETIGVPAGGFSILQGTQARPA